MADSHKSSSHNSIKIGLRATWIGIVINLLLAIIKALVGFFGNSYALIADAIESTTDVFTSIIVWFGIKFASKAPDPNHPYGHGKAEPLAAIVVSLCLLAAALLIARQSIHNIITPHELPSFYTLPVLLSIVLIKEILFRYVNKVSAEIGSTVVKADAWHHRSDAITSATAFIGIVIALIGGKGYEGADDWAALIASAFIVYNGITIMRPAFDEIMDAAPSEELLEEVREGALKVEGVRGLDKSFIRKMGFEFYVDLHVIVDGNLSVKEGHDIAHRVKDAILFSNKTINDVLIHIEPDNKLEA
ncbi:MAG TPA: cation diffusion facilitator family transporter [Cytophagales bacterium]|nr:cation diffusion facilitator family transporter [Cytophagales bacterium]